MEFNFNCIGALRKNKKGKYEFVVRWFMNGKEDSSVTHLPSPEGKFSLLIRTKKSGQYINSAGQLVPIPVGAKDLPEIRPLNYLMISPPKKTSVPPTAPIDPKDQEGTKGIGVYHILAEPAVSRYAKKINEKTLHVLKSHSKLLSNKVFKELSPERYSKKLTDYLLSNRIKPKNLQAIFVAEFKRLEQLTFENKELKISDPVPGFLSFHLEDTAKSLADPSSKQNTFESVWQNTLLLKDLLKDINFLQDINNDVEQAENLKSQFSMLGLQGTEIIDYWCSPKVSQQNRVEEDCGKKYPTSEAVGLGTTIGELDEAVVQGLLNSGDTIVIEVEYFPPSKEELWNSKHYDWAGLHDEDYLEEMPAAKANNLIQNKGVNSLENAITRGSSCPPDKPKMAVVEYDLFLKRLKSVFSGVQDLKGKVDFTENLETGTGDGKVLFKFYKPDEKPFPPFEAENSSIITGVNVYGLWEPKDLASPFVKYFRDESLNPSLEEIKPWMVTRRYSYYNDLKPFFAAANVNVLNNQSNPPMSPAFQSPEKVTNPESVVHVDQANKVYNETMPDRNKNDVNEQTVLFSINIREGFLNAFVPAIQSTWDKFPRSAMPANWCAEQWKGAETEENSPQRYRFWATSVDIFGQESELIPVVNKETSTAAESKFFSFKYRQSLQPPPSNNESEKNNISIEYSKNRLTVRWKSPFKNTLGNSSVLPSGEPVAALRIGKDFLHANVLYMRKPTNKSFLEYDDSQLESIVQNILNPLSSEFKNEKWRIGLREIYKHNSGWSVFKAFSGIAGAGADDVWTHEVATQNTDSGFDYIALVNFEIRDDKRQFWISNDKARNLYITEQKSANPLNKDSYVQIGPKQTEEMPCISNLAYTEIQLVADMSPPRMVKVLKNKFIPAAPVFGVPGINRDLVLSNILTTPHEVKNVMIGLNSAKAVVFSKNEEGLIYTEGQKIMIDAALSRCREAELDTSVAKKILMTEVSNLNKKVYPEKKANDDKVYPIFENKESNHVVAGDLIGFRGVQRLNLRYDSVLSNIHPLGNPESEALKYQVYQTRIALKSTLILNTSFKAKSFKLQNNTKLSDVVFDSVIKPMEINAPTTVIIRYTQGYFISQLTKITDAGASKFSIDLTEALYTESVSGTPVELLFVIASQILEKEIDLKGEFYEDNIALPVGGGYKELFVWNIRTSSALGRYSDTSYTIHEVFGSSVLPPTPKNVFSSAINTNSEKNTFALSHIADHKPWLPREVQDAGINLKTQPRIYIQWEKDNKLPDDVFLAIERDFREEEVSALKVAKTTENAWDLASKIEKRQFSAIDENNPDDLLYAKWLSQGHKPSLYSWLYESAEIEIPGEMSAKESEIPQIVGPLSLIPEKVVLSKGLLADAAAPGNSVFVDYFYDNDDLNYNMDTFRSYNYRFSSYVDIDPNGVLGISDPKQRYLYSRSTEWSGWIRPTFPEPVLALLPRSVELPETGLLKPKVEFNFVLKEELTFMKVSEVKPLFYRVIVKKEIKNAITSKADQPGSSAFIEVGGVLNIPVRSTVGAMTITDDDLERETILSPVNVNYRVEVSVITELNEKVYFVRKEKKLDVNIEIKSLPLDKEFKKSVFIKID